MKPPLFLNHFGHRRLARRGSLTNLPFATLAALFACLAIAGNSADAQQTKEKSFTRDEDTIMLLQAQPDGLKDKSGSFEAILRGGTIVPDEVFGHALQFGGEALNDISVADGGRFDFSRGMTVEMQVQLRQPDEAIPHPGGSLFVKMGSFYSTLQRSRFDVAWMTFPSLPVATTTERQYKTYPATDTGFPGYLDVPGNRWVHLAFTYDPALKVARTWVDGKLDWTEYYQRPEAMPLLNDARSALSFLSGMTDVRVAEIRVSRIARAIEPLTPFETYAHALPYRNESAVIFDHIQSPALPLEVVLQSGGKTLHRFLLEDSATRTVLFDTPVTEGDYPLTIKATAKGKEVYSREVNLYAGDSSTQPVKIDDQNRLVMAGKPVFPLIIYHTLIEDVPALAKMGFNLFTARHPNSAAFALSAAQEDSIAIVKEFLKVAKDHQISMLLNNGIFTTGGWKTEINRAGIEALTDDPALGVWYGADEPGRDRIIQLQEGYTAAKQLTKRPIFSLTNRYDHLQRLAESADILGSDPYPIPNISLRSVADFTRASVRATAGLKPVWTILPQYQYYENDNKRPTLAELRSMAYLAIASGANGLGIYAWDDRDFVNKKGYQWYTKEHPETVKILESVIGELSALQEVLIIPNSSRELSFLPANPALHVALKESGEQTYLLVVSDSRKAEEATLSLKGLLKAEGVDLHDPTKKLSIKNGKVEVSLLPLGAHLYKLSNVKKD